MLIQLYIRVLLFTPVFIFLFKRLASIRSRYSRREISFTQSVGRNEIDNQRIRPWDSRLLCLERFFSASVRVEFSRVSGVFYGRRISRIRKTRGKSTAFMRKANRRHRSYVRTAMLSLLSWPERIVQCQTVALSFSLHPSISPFLYVRSII